MSFKTGDQVPGGDGEKAADEPKFASPDEMIAFARGYFASDFPNPKRTGCPEPGAIGELVRAGRQPDAELRAHLFGCSECFVEFDREMRARHGMQPAVSWWSKLPAAPSLRPAPLLAGVLFLLLVALAGIYLRHVYWERTAPDIADDQPTPVTVPRDEVPKDDSTALPMPQASPTHVTPAERAEKSPRPRETARRQAPSLPRTRAPRQDAGELVAANTVKVDLEEYAALRGGEGGENAIKLSRSPTRLELTLPEGSIEGLYSLSILDPSGKALVTAKARSANGKALSAVLDSRKLAPRKYRLRLLREGEAPQYYPLVVGEGTKAAPRVRDP
jgi:hypothetical protein